MIQDLLRGARSVPKATRLILQDRTLLLLSVVPILLSVGLYAFIFKGLLSIMHAKLLAWTALSGSGLLQDVAGFLVTALLFIAMSIAVFFSLVFTTSLLASPFSDWLSERTEVILGHSTAVPFSFKRMLRVFLVDLKKTAFIAICALILSLISFVPLLTPILAIMTPLLVALQFVVYPMSRREEGVRDSLAWMRKNLGACFGFGAVVALGFGVPVLSLLLIPTAVVAGTILYCEGRTVS